MEANPASGNGPQQKAHPRVVVPFEISRSWPFGNRRFTRLTHVFSKKIENHEAAIGLHYGHYNWCRVHQTTRVTPAMEAGLTDHVREIEDLVALLETQELEAIDAGAMKRGTYKRRDADANG